MLRAKNIVLSPAHKRAIIYISQGGSLAFPSGYSCLITNNVYIWPDRQMSISQTRWAACLKRITSLKQLFRVLKEYSFTGLNSTKIKSTSVTIVEQKGFVNLLYFLDRVKYFLLMHGYIQNIDWEKSFVNKTLCIYTHTHLLKKHINVKPLMLHIKTFS